MEFCKAFNARTAQIEKGSPIPVVITAYQDRSFTFEMRQPPVTFWLKKAAGLKIGKTPRKRFALQCPRGRQGGDAIAGDQGLLDLQNTALAMIGMDQGQIREPTRSGGRRFVRMQVAPRAP